MVLDASALLCVLNGEAFGLSLGDRACLALAAELGIPALTADQTWAGLDIGVKVELIRG